MARLRVVQWSTGGVGAIALRAGAAQPDLELAGAGTPPTRARGAFT